MYSNARLQAFSSRSGVYLSQTHARLVALLLYFVAAENGLDSDLRVAADFTGPVNEPFTIPLDILLVLWRHVLLDRAVLVKPSVQPGMGTDSVSTVENLCRGFGEPDIYLLLDVFKGNRIIHTLHRNVVIWSHCCHFPGGQFKRSGRQRAQKGPFFRKAAGPAMIAIRDLEMTKERLLSFAEYAKDAQPEVLVTLIQTIVERIYIVDKDDERYCHIFIKGCSGEDYTGFFQTAGYIEQKTTPVCDSEQYCIDK